MTVVSSQRVVFHSPEIKMDESPERVGVPVGGGCGEPQIEVHREVKADAPAVLQALIGEWNSLIQSETWQTEEVGEEYYNEFEIESEGTPVTITGTMTLSGDSESCVNEVELTIRCGVPLVGRKVEEFVAKDSAKNLAAEYEFIQEYLESD